MIMYEYLLDSLTTPGKSIAVYGYSIDDAFRRSGLNPEEWECWHIEYID